MDRDKMRLQFIYGACWALVVSGGSLYEIPRRVGKRGGGVRLTTDRLGTRPSEAFARTNANQSDDCKRPLRLRRSWRRLRAPSRAREIGIRPIGLKRYGFLLMPGVQVVFSGPIRTSRTHSTSHRLPAASDRCAGLARVGTCLFHCGAWASALAARRPLRRTRSSPPLVRPTDPPPVSAVHSV